MLLKLSYNRFVRFRLKRIYRINLKIFLLFYFSYNYFVAWGFAALCFPLTEIVYV